MNKCEISADCRADLLTGDDSAYVLRLGKGEDDDGQANSKPRYKQLVKPKPEDEACPEWHAMVKAVSDYVEITGEPKKDVWERWGKSVGKRDAEMCLAVVADIERALNG